MIKRSYGFLFLLLTIAVCASGCETLKGMKKDVENLFDAAKETPSTLQKVDAKVREALW